MLCRVFLSWGVHNPAFFIFFYQDRDVWYQWQVVSRQVEISSCDSDLLNMSIITSPSWLARAFRTWPGMMSSPAALLVFIFSRIPSTSVEDTDSGWSRGRLDFTADYLLRRSKQTLNGFNLSAGVATWWGRFCFWSQWCSESFAIYLWCYLCWDLCWWLSFSLLMPAFTLALALLYVSFKAVKVNALLMR